MSIATLPPTKTKTAADPAAPRPVSGPPLTASDPATVALDPAAAVSKTAAEASGVRRRGFPGGLTRAQMITAAVIVVAALTLAGVGLYLSFAHVAAFAHERLHFRTLAQGRLFTVGVDIGILVLIALDLLMAWLRRPIGWVRLPVWLLTGATIVLNAASAAPAAGAWTALDYVASFAHGIVPVLFIAIVEVGKTSIDRVVRADAVTSEGVPLCRWFLAPGRTFALWRRMKLWAVATYAQAVALDQELRVYRVMLEREHGSVRKAPSDAKLPLTMSRYGLTVEQALALPLEAEQRETARREAEQDARAAEEARKQQRAAGEEIARVRASGAVQAARTEVAASTKRAEVLAAAEIGAVERAAQLEEEALETATIVKARARTAAAERREAEERLAAATADEEAAKAARRAADERRAAAEADKVAAAEAEAVETATIAEARQRAANADLETAKLERRAADERRAAAEADKVAAAEAEAVETATIAEARERAAEADGRTAETELRAAEARRAAAEADRKAADEKARQEAALADAEARKRAAAEAARAAAETRRAAAEIELRATEMEDVAKLKPRERAVRKVARMVLATAGGVAKQLPLADIQRELATSPGTASEYRQEAELLLHDGYRPGAV